MSKSTERAAHALSEQLLNATFSGIEATARHFAPLNSSASILARTLGSSLNGTTDLSFDEIRSRVAPPLFLSLSVLPHASRASYAGNDALTFSYFTDNDDTFAVFSNSTAPSSCYVQPVNRDTGRLYGQPVSCAPKVHANSTIGGAAATEFDEKGNLQFVYGAAMDGRGYVTVGFPAAAVAGHFSGLNFNGGDFQLATADGRVIVGSKLREVRVDVKNGTVSVDKSSGHYYSCEDRFHTRIKGKRHVFYCSGVQIGGIASVYVLALPTRGLAHENRPLVMTLLVLVLVIIVVSVGGYVIAAVRYARREMFLCAALVKQMDSTQQAERKSMNKSLAFASASHDIRASLAAITGLIDLCLDDEKVHSNIAASLGQMSNCATDLLGILNSVLDTSKIEAGKMQLEEEEFNVAQLLEDVVDMFYPVGMKKGVDVVLDPCDGSILKFSNVVGDKGKLKQILSNLLSNATKFTSEGHILVRATVRKTSIENEIIASNRKSVLSCLSKMCDKNKGSLSNLESLHTVQENPDSMEYVFEVDDTGKGIPRDRQRSVFENFVQVKETAQGQGTGLGLGIVQSLVRLMGGEIKIVNKEHGQRGTCFRFNVFLIARDRTSGDIEEGIMSYANNDDGDIHSRFGMHFRSVPPKSDASHVILYIAGEARRKISKRLIRSFGLRVLAVKRTVDFHRALERIKQKADPMSSPETFRESSPKEERPSSILVVIDSNAGPVSELSAALAGFRKEVQNAACKFVWLENLVKQNSSLGDEKMIVRLCDHVLSRPLHGSHLYRVLGLLPEFGGSSLLGGKTQITEDIHFYSKERKIQTAEVKIVRAPENEVESIEKKPLEGKNVLVVEDDNTLRMLSTKILGKLGANIQVCQNGEEALDLVCQRLKDGEEGGLPFDCIFMDCKMPVMGGFEATRLIRKEEQVHGVHIPIVALTSYSAPEEISLTSKAGMDFHLVKPLRIDDVLKMIKDHSFL
ncbi:histidine kinase 1 plant [Striga asiatica]|uniref:histidine kinase n=1 Tax=Striga asiatica TaxID=4170 RepID=A0A5A7QW26_STRAF|nr:histidine kinase 1 plant [Striga asiatica]